MALFKSFVNCISISTSAGIDTSDGPSLLNGSLCGTLGVSLFGVLNSSIVCSCENPLVLSSLKPMWPDEAAGVNGLAKLVSEDFFAV